MEEALAEALKNQSVLDSREAGFTIYFKLWVESPNGR